MLNQLLHLIVGLVVIIPIPFGIMWVVMKWADMNESGMGYKGRYKKKENE
jgi:cadmium resistance protein CadD (predicted permease)